MAPGARHPDRHSQFHRGHRVTCNHVTNRRRPTWLVPCLGGWVGGHCGCRVLGMEAQRRSRIEAALARVPRPAISFDDAAEAILRQASAIAAHTHARTHARMGSQGRWGAVAGCGTKGAASGGWYCVICGALCVRRCRFRAWLACDCSTDDSNGNLTLPRTHSTARGPWGRLTRRFCITRS